NSSLLQEVNAARVKQKTKEIWKDFLNTFIIN
ncbi:MAG: hypothetical protein ACI81W_003652, partial [Saprospiraceae bacterium]